MADSNEIDKAKKDAKNVIDNYEEGMNKLNAAAQRNAEIEKEIKKLEPQKFIIDKIEKALDKNKNTFLAELGNVQVISSDICGLGKSGKIRKLFMKN